MEVERQLEAYAALIREWAPRMNLVSAEDLPRLEQRHIQDSLKALPLVEQAPPGPCIDLGSGAGLPGIPLAISTPHREWRLVEPRRQRVAFLEEAVRTLALTSVEIGAFDDMAAVRRWGPVHGLATARALAEPSQAFEMMAPLLEDDGIGGVFLGEHSRLPPGSEEWQKGLAIVRKVRGS